MTEQHPATRVPSVNALSSTPRARLGVEDERHVGHTVISVFLLAVIIPLRGIHHLIPGFPDLPLNTIAAIILMLLAFFMRPRWQISLPMFTLAAGALWVSLLLPSALFQDPFDLRRAGSLTALFGLAYALGSGRLHLDSIRRGVLVGLLFGVFISVIRLGNTNSSYEGRLTGVLGDPNGIGFTIVALGCIVAQQMTSRRNLLLLWMFMAGTIWLTQSRTSMFALAIATLWAVFGRRFGRVLSLAILVGVVWGFQWASEFAERQGWFQERLGSDNLRDRLAEVEQTLTDSAGWWGHGLGTAAAEFDGIFLFFHNSYRALQTEGGLTALILLIVMGISLYWNFHELPSTHRPMWAEAAIIGALICSINIGYSLTSVPMAMTVGMYIAYHCLAREELATESTAGELEKTEI